MFKAPWKLFGFGFTLVVYEFVRWLPLPQMRSDVQGVNVWLFGRSYFFGKQRDYRQPPVSRTIEVITIDDPVVPQPMSEEQAAQIANVLQAPAPRSLPQVMDMLASVDATASRLLDKRR